MRNAPDTLMLFAAGFGTRMLPLTATQPKPLLKVAGKALIDHALDYARVAGVSRIVVNTHYLGEQIADHLAGSGIDIIHESPDILETGGGLRNAMPLLGTGPVIVMNTDAIWTGPNPLKTLAAHWDADQMDALHLLVPVGRASGLFEKGDWDRDAAGRLTRGTTFIYGGAHITRTDRLMQIAARSFSLNVVWDQMISEQRLFGTIHAGGWCDVGRPESIAMAEALLKTVHV